MQLPDRLVTDEALCFCRAQAGDNDAQDALVRLHLPLVHSLVRRFLGRGADADDLIQQGVLGLLQAIRGFDPARGFQFSTYAVPHILGEIRRFLRKATPLHLDRRMQAQARQLRRAQEQLAQALGRMPTLLELSRQSGVPAEEIPLALEALRPPLSLEQPADAAQEGASLGELLAAPAAPEGEMLFLREQISRWPPRERLLFTRRFVEGCTQQEIAQELGLSQVQVSRLLKKLCTALRDLLQEEG